MEDSNTAYLRDGGKHKSASNQNYNHDHEVIRNEFIDDLNLIHLSENPIVIPEIELVYVLAGRSTVLGRDADGLDREVDLSDDLLRMQLGIKIAKEANALKAEKSIDDLTEKDMVIPIFYHGRKAHNEDLVRAIRKGVIDYPQRLFVIREALPENTIGQAKSLNRYLERQSHRTIALVSSAYHLPRIARTFGNLSPQAQNQDGTPNQLGESRFILYGVDRAYKNKGTTIDLFSEVDAMTNYSLGINSAGKPTISLARPKNTAITSSDLFWLGNDIKRRLTNQPSAQDSNEALFTRYNSENYWGNTESKSGVGSTLDNTKTIREKIPNLIDQFNFQTMLDIPCGDMNYMKHIDLKDVEYIGADIVPDIVEKNRKTLPDRDFYTLDITSSQLPSVDLVLCRDLFIHMPNEQIEKALLNVAKTGSKYFMCEMFTSNLSQCSYEINAQIETGQFRPTNITLPPFSFSEPIAMFKEDRGEGKKVMGLFDMSDVRSHAASEKGLKI